MAETDHHGEFERGGNDLMLLLGLIALLRKLKPRAQTAVDKWTD